MSEVELSLQIFLRKKLFFSLFPAQGILSAIEYNIKEEITIERLVKNKLTFSQ